MRASLSAEPNAVSNVMGNAKFYSRPHDAVIRVHDKAGNLIDTHEHTGDQIITPGGEFNNENTTRGHAILKSPLSKSASISPSSLS